MAIYGSAREQLEQTVLQTIESLQARGAALPADVLDYRAEMLADLRGSGTGRRTKSITAVNAYQGELDSIYSNWSEKTARDVADADEDRRDEILAAALAALLLKLKETGHQRLTESMLMALGGAAPTPEMVEALTDAMRENDQYLENSLIPDIGEKMRRALQDPDILAALTLGALSARRALSSVFGTLRARVALYAGAWWSLFNKTFGLGADKSKKPVKWYLDPAAKHCQDCPRYGSAGGRRYESYAAMLAQTGGKSPASGVQCGGNCRCWIGYA